MYLGTGQVGNSSVGSPLMDNGRIRACLKDRLQTELGITQFDQKPAKNNGAVANRAVSVKRTSIRTGAGGHSGCAIWKWAFETV